MMGNPPDHEISKFSHNETRKFSAKKEIFLTMKIFNISGVK